MIKICLKIIFKIILCTRGLKQIKIDTHARLSLIYIYIYVMVTHCYNCMVVKKNKNKNITYFILIVFRVLHLLYDT